MNKYLLLLLIFLTACKKDKSFADDIILTTDSNLKMKIQEFNEGLSERGTTLIYVGKQKDSIPVKYYYSTLSAPPPPPGLFLKTGKEKKDSLDFDKIQDKYFLNDFDRIRFSDKPVEFDSLTNDLLKIVVKSNQVIPHFVRDSANKVKAYKSFPVFIKNISGRKLILQENEVLGTFVLNRNEKWQLIWNNNFFVCGDNSWNRRYWVLNPDEIIIYAVNYFEGTKKVKFKIAFSTDLLSEEFEGVIDPKIIAQQRMLYELK